jgi:hypothetical protein
VKISASETARKVIKDLGTGDVFAIAALSGVKIVYQSWYPVTCGEYDKKSKSICVNLRTLTDNKLTKEKIIAHELGHFFAGEFSLSRAEEEAFACEFAEELTKNGSSI